jgi:arylsulfatase A-like enzyme
MRVRTALLIAAWFGIVAGLFEGSGLLLFQRLNWASWGPMLHVSLPIIWISPIVDVALFCLVGLSVLGLARITPKIQPGTAIVFFLTFATIYDWANLTGRIYHSSSLLLALGIAIGVTRWFANRQAFALIEAKRSLPMLIVLLLALGLGIKAERHWREHQKLAALPAASPGLPNIVVIVIDTLRADHLSSYGYARSTSPTIDRLAREGVLFENAVSTSSWSLPSHASLVTGQPVHQHGADYVKPMAAFGDNENNFRNLPTIGEQLQQLGYRTAAFSANRTWFSHDLGFGRSFIHFEDYFHSVADGCIRTLYGREFSRIYLARSEHSKPKRLLRWLGLDALTDSDDEGVGNNGGSPGVRKRAPVVNQELLDWIGPQPQRPFFAFLNYFDVHQPYSGPSSFNKPWIEDTAIDEYDNGIRYVDSSIVALISSLEKRGLLRSTLIVITSDHGESLGQHGLATHGAALYWESIHVPLILWWPGHVTSGLRITDPVSNASIPATLMNLVGNDRASVFPGPSLNALWSQPAVTPPPVLSELSARHFPAHRPGDNLLRTSDSGAIRSVISGHWHLIHHEKYGTQIFDWAQDPNEVHDLYDPNLALPPQ